MQNDKHKNAKKVLKEIDCNPSNYLIIHYSCESFYDITDGHTPRITSIAVYSYSTAQTDSFSIHNANNKFYPPFILTEIKEPLYGDSIYIFPF